MNLKNRLYVKSSSDIKIKRENSNLIIENKSKKREQIIFIKPIITDRTNYSFINEIKTIRGNDCNIKLLSKTLKVVDSFEQNTRIYLQNVPKLCFIGISFEPESKYELKKLECLKETTDEDDLKEYFKGNILLLTPGYPSNFDKYLCAFVHTRVKEYKKHGLNVDVAVVSDLYINKTEFYNFERQDVCRTGYNQIRNLLIRKKYDKILVHFIRPPYLRILGAINNMDTQIMLYTHGVDTLYHDYEKIGAPYFTNDYKVPEDIVSSYSERDELIKDYNEKENVKFVFVSDWNRKYAEKLLNIKFKNYDIVPGFIDEKLFKYEKKDPELRKKVFIIRPQNNLRTYAMDINVRAILELSHRECFKDIEFSIYGTGSEHDKLLAPLYQFENVHIYNKFLTHEEIAKVHQENGICLNATRFESHGVTACEAAMSGTVLITSKHTATSEYIDESIGTFCETENYKEYADIIEKIYNDPKLFLDLSKKMHEAVMNTCSYNYSLKKDIEAIKSFDAKENIEIPTLKKEPLLSISVAGYNISDYVIQLVNSILRSKYADEMEILVVNDGSKDDTVEKCNKYVKDHYHGKGEPMLRVIDKENGGHGSTINKGLELATGKYFKVLDGDDYYITSELDKLIEILKTNTADVVLTDYLSDFSITGKAEISNNYPGLVPGVLYNLDDVCYPNYGFINWGPQLHTSTYKTKLLQNANFKIDEHCFYVDMEYNLIGIIEAKTVVYYPLHIYSYYLGRPGQSVSAESYKKNVLMHEKVCLRLIKELKERKVTPGKTINIIDNMIIPLCKMQYDIATEYFKNGKNFRSFDRKLKEYPEFYHDPRLAGRRNKFHRLTNGHLIFLNPVIKFFGKLTRRG